MASARRSSAEIHARLGHPVVDADGHVLESVPVLAEYVREFGGPATTEHFLHRLDVTSISAWADASIQNPWWGTPTGALDRASAYLPNLLASRLDEMGIDFAILYGSLGLNLVSSHDEELRRGGCRALNAYLRDLTAADSDRLTPAAMIPLFTPQEAIDELEYATGPLGLRTIAIPGWVPRAHDGRVRPDVIGVDSEYDYDPFWARCVELGVAVTSHGGSQGVGFRQSPTRYMYNHVGHFRAAHEAFAAALVMGGVTYRFPTLNFAFLEGGAAWGALMLADLAGRWDKRGGPNIGALDPSRLDVEAFDALLDAHADPRTAQPESRRAMAGFGGSPPGELDDFHLAAIGSRADLANRFAPRFWFGCEADDPTNAVAFLPKLNPFGVKLQAMLGSDIGHWDVPDMRNVLHEAHELVDHGLLDADDFRDFACDHVIRLHGGMNAAYFEGTTVGAHASQVLAGV